jgi:hypothetical protein|tara:strand:- start:1786 stop:2097 length:312 start_codon:yes stop_codon:yes gene_type:complete
MAGILKTAQDRLSAVAQDVTGGQAANEYKFPAFDELPKVDGMPQGSIWGFYDKDGKKDEAGGKLDFTLLRFDHELTFGSRQPPDTIRRSGRFPGDHHRRAHPT